MSFVRGTEFIDARPGAGLIVAARPDRALGDAGDNPAGEDPAGLGGEEIQSTGYDDPAAPIELTQALRDHLRRAQLLADCSVGRAESVEEPSGHWARAQRDHADAGPAELTGQSFAQR